MSSLRRFLGLWLVLTLVAVVSPPSAAMERSGALAPDRHDWAAGATCSISYYNICTGWIWVWQPSNDDRFGVVFDRCAEHCEVSTSWVLFTTGAPSGRGYTGTTELFAVDDVGCPVGTPLASQSFLPGSGWNMLTWGVDVPDRFLFSVTIAPFHGLPTPVRFSTDRPSGGPTGPVACGNCFPADRVTRSFLYGDVDSPLCPGERFSDPVCDAELLMDVQLSCTDATRDDTWGRVKDLFR
ncbi:MAG: hypothetical protein R3B81_17150 [bacterium]